MGIWGIFKDSEGRVFLQFGKAIGAELAIHAEVLVLREGLLVATVGWWVPSHSFLFES